MMEDSIPLRNLKKQIAQVKVLLWGDFIPILINLDKFATFHLVRTFHLTEFLKEISNLNRASTTLSQIFNTFQKKWNPKFEIKSVHFFSDAFCFLCFSC